MVVTINNTPTAFGDRTIMTGSYSITPPHTFDLSSVGFAEINAIFHADDVIPTAFNAKTAGNINLPNQITFSGTTMTVGTHIVGIGRETTGTFLVIGRRS